MRYFLFFLFIPLFTFASNLTPHQHGVFVYGGLKYEKGFTHFDYVNPYAPKGGTVKLASIGTFDNLNPYIIKGVAVSGAELLFDRLMEVSADEISSAYGLVAESIALSDDGRFIEISLRKEARFHDNSPITAEDVAFSLELFKHKAHPVYRSYYKDVERAEILSQHRLRIYFTDPNNKELPFIAAKLPVLSKAYYTTHDFEATTLTPPLGSGPYKVDSVDPGRVITYVRHKDYWAKDLPVNRGRYNFNRIQMDYYRDATVAIEALKAGEYDFRRENIAKNWAKAYNIEQVDQGKMIKEELPDGTPTGMQAFVFNLRKALFQNRNFRKALNLAYDFEWSNEQLFHSAYRRNISFFGNSVFASSGLPSNAERTLLAPFKHILPQHIWNQAYQPFSNDGSGNARKHLLKARDLLEQEGFVLRDMKLIDPNTDMPVVLEFLLVSPSFERVVAPFIKNLNKLGIEGKIRTVDSAQYIRRRQTFDFDITVHWYRQGAYPGNEQFNYWHSSTAQHEGSGNLAGIDHKAVDAMVENILGAKDLTSLTDASRALDRILLWNYYVIPQWHSRTHRVIYWNRFGRPNVTPPYALGMIDTWWVK